jgi:hypothetical protein
VARGRIAVGDRGDQTDRQAHQGARAAAGVAALAAADRRVDRLDDQVGAVGAVGVCRGGSVRGAIRDRGGVRPEQPKGDESLVAWFAVSCVAPGG